MNPPEIPTEPAVHTHDGFFKAVFSQPEHATAFFKNHLPANVAALIDWPSLVLLPGSFVKTSLQQVHSDLLFSVRIGERETLLYLLFEHQSTRDPAMPLRMLGYVAEIYLKHHKEHKFPLPPVLPFVLHQGPDPWNSSTAFEDLLDLPEEAREALSPYLPKFHHALLDLTQFDPADAESDKKVRAVLQLMKLARTKELLRFFRWLSQYPAKDISENLLRLILLYAMHSDNSLDVQTIYHNLSSNTELEKNAMSVAEKLKAEGRIEGLAAGRTEGKWVGKIQTLEEFLEKPISENETLEAMSIEELESLHATLHREYEIRFKRR